MQPQQMQQQQQMQSQMQTQQMQSQMQSQQSQQMQLQMQSQQQQQQQPLQQPSFTQQQQLQQQQQQQQQSPQSPQKPQYSSTQVITSDVIAGIAVKVIGSNKKTNDKGKEVLAFVILVGQARVHDGTIVGMEKELWRVEKLYSDFLALDSKVWLDNIQSCN
jgi:hypothetical protein